MSPSATRALALAGTMALLTAGFLAAQSASPSPSPSPRLSPSTASSPTSSPTPGGSPGSKAPGLPLGFRGMGAEAVKAILKADDLLAYSGDEDVSLLPSGSGSVIDVPGDSFIKRATFQFLDDKLWAMVFTLDTLKIDHYSVFTAMSAKYGKPGKIDPKESVWEDGKIRVSIERPLTLKYLDLATLEGLNQKAGTEKAFREVLRDDFLKQF